MIDKADRSFLWFFFQTGLKTFAAYSRKRFFIQNIITWFSQKLPLPTGQKNFAPPPPPPPAKKNAWSQVIPPPSKLLLQDFVSEENDDESELGVKIVCFWSKVSRRNNKLQEPIIIMMSSCKLAIKSKRLFWFSRKSLSCINIISGAAHA